MMARQAPKKAMVLAAGLGLRMRPLTEDRPKPLVEVGGKTLIDRILDRLADAGVRDAVVNLHYLGGMLERHLGGRERPRVVFSHEEDALLDTGGGVKRALPKLGERPFYALNGDVLWLDGLRPALLRMADFWDARRMDGLLLLHPTSYALGYEGIGDFMLSPEGRIRRRKEREIAPFAFTGMQILHPRILKDTPEGAFSLNLVYDRAIERERLFGLRHDGEWFHVGTPEDLAKAEEALFDIAGIAVHR
jgi:MurNAc alpha-1-phosphate uridylyltransferase